MILKKNHPHRSDLGEAMSDQKIPFFFHCDSRHSFARIFFAPSVSLLLDHPLKVTGIRGATIGKPLPIPLYLSRISAGFPSPADDFADKKIDLNEHLIRHPAATFYVRAVGDSMTGLGIFSGDLLVVDRAEEVRDGAVVVAVVDGEFLVKQVRKEGKRLFLLPANADYRPLEVTEAMEFELWGVVTNVIHSLSR